MDEDDKIRRNLVMVSFVILAFDWLDIPLSSIVGKTLGVVGPMPDQLKIWTMGLLLMVYFAIRYKFSDEGAKFQSETRKELDGSMGLAALRLAKAQFERMGKTGRVSDVFDPECRRKVDELREVAKSRGSGDVEPHFSVGVAVQGDIWNFTLALNVEWERGPGSVGSERGRNIQVSVVGWRRLLIQFQSMVHVYFYSASSIKYLVPVVLAFVAVARLSWKVFLSVA